MSGYVINKKVPKRFDGVDYEIQFFQDIHENEYLVIEVHDGVYHGKAQLFEKGVLKYSFTYERGIRSGQIISYKNGVVEAVRLWEGLLVSDLEDRCLENRSYGMVLVIRDKDTDHIIYEGNGDEMIRQGFGYEFDRETGERKSYGYFEDDEMVQLICEFDGDQMTEYWYNEKENNMMPYQRHHIYIGGYYFVEDQQRAVRHGKGVTLDAVTGVAIFAGEWVNGNNIAGVTLNNGWYCEGFSEKSLKVVVDEEVFRLAEKRVEEEQRIAREKEEAEQAEYERMRLAEESIDVVVKNVNDLSNLCSAVMRLSVSNNCCNHKVKTLKFNSFPQLKEIQIGDCSFKEVSTVEICDNPELVSICVGKCSFTQYPDEIEERKSYSLTIARNHALSKIVFDEKTFAEYYAFTLDGIHSSSL